MNKATFFLLVIILRSLFGFGQNSLEIKVLDSAYKLMQKEKYFESINIIDSIQLINESKNDLALLRKVYNLKGLAYIQLNDFKTAQENYIKSINISKEINKSFLPYYSNLIHSYVLAEENKSAYEHIKLFKQFVKDEIDVFYVYESELILFDNEKKYSNMLDLAIKAKNQLNKDVYSSTFIKNPILKQRLEIIFDIYHVIALMELNKNIANSTKILNKLEKTPIKDVLWSNDRVYSYITKIYQYKFQLSKNQDSSNYYFNKVIQSNKESINYIKSKDKNSTYFIKNLIKNKSELEKVKLNLKIEKVNKKKRTYYYFILISFVIILISLYYNFKIKKSSKVISVKNHDVEKLNSELKLLITEIDNNNLSLKNKNSEIKELLHINEKSLFAKTMQIITLKDKIKTLKIELNKMINSKSEFKIKKLYEIEKELNTVLSDNDIWDDFKLHFEKTRPDFFKKLKAINPNLTVNDLKHCTYIISNLKSKDVANLINVSPRSVETTRYRLSKKLNLDKNIKLYDFLNDL